MEQRTEHVDSHERPGARALLRSATRVAHERMEADLVLMSPDLTLEDYVATLRRFLTVHRVLDRALEPHTGSLRRLGFEWSPGSTVSRLRRDLDVLSPRSASGSVGPEQAPPLPLPTTCHALGALYVVEGANLGGMVIRRHLERVLRIGAEDGASFFHGHGTATGARWKQLCQLLDRHLTEAPSLERAVTGANATFFLFAEGVARQP